MGIGRAARSSADARWHNHRRGAEGALFRPLDPPTRREGRDNERRDLRYVALNPTRAGHVGCPLAWPFSSHRDAVGLAMNPVRPSVVDREEHHRYVSSDPSFRVDGTVLPDGCGAPLALDAVAAAVSEALRRPISEIRTTTYTRARFIQAALALTEARHRDIGDHARVTRRHVLRAEPIDPVLLRIVEHIGGDPRFPGLHDSDRRLNPIRSR